MHPLPADFDSAFLLNKAVDAINFARYDIVIQLTGEAWIQIHGAFEHCCANCAPQSATAGAIEQTSLPRLNGTTICGVSTPENRHLQLRFSNGDSLLLLAGEHYESYSLFDGNRRIIV